MFKNTKRLTVLVGKKQVVVEGKDGGWRFDWINDRGDEYRGLRFYPETGILSSWSRRASKYKDISFHPYRINDYDWPRIRQACKDRWGMKEIVEIVMLVPKMDFMGKLRTEQEMIEITAHGFEYWVGQGKKIQNVKGD